MNKKVKQIIYGLAMNIAFIVGFVFMFILDSWLSVFILIGLLLFTHLVCYWILTPDCIRKFEWNEEGYFSMSEWWRNSNPSDCWTSPSGGMVGLLLIIRC